MSNSLQKDNNNGLQNWQANSQFNSNNYDSEDMERDPLDPKRIISLIFRYKWVILTFMAVGVLGAWIYTETATPLYESKGQLLISSNEGATNDEASNMISQTTGHGTSSTFENELQVLKSREFSRQIASELIKDDPGNRNEFPILWSVEEDGDVYKNGEEVVASRIRSGMSFSKPAEDSDVVEISYTSPSPKEAAKVVNVAMNLYVESSTEQNRRAAASTAEFLQKEKEEIQQKLEESEEELRRFMDSTGIVQVEEQASGMVDRREQLEMELQRVNLELQTIEQTIANYEEQLEDIKPGLSDQFSEAVGPRIKNSQEELAQLEYERAQIISKNPGILDRENKPAELQKVDEQIQSLKDKIRNLSERLFTEEGEFLGMDGENRAQMIADIQSRLVEARIEQNQLQSRRDALAQQKEEIDANFESLPEGMTQLAKLQRSVRINEELYTNVSRQHADMSIWKQSQFGFGRIIDSGSVPSSPVSPNTMIAMLLGIMLSGFLSVGFIAVREFMDNSVKNVNQIRNIYPPSLTLSVIPTFDESSNGERKTFKVGSGMIPKEMVLLRDAASIPSEAFRRLKNKIIYQQGEMPPKTIAITSPEKADGKSTVAANLGVAFAEEGFKTLVIDADFRRPKIQKYFGLTDKSGLSDYLNGDLPFQQLLMLIQNSELPRLKILTAGNKIKGGEIVGNSKAFKQFLDQMKDVFDVILLDTPPFGIISDSTSLLKNAETTLVVARHNKTNKKMLLRTIEELGQVKANVTDIVLTDFDYRKETGYGYGADYYQSLYSNYEAYIEE